MARPGCIAEDLTEVAPVKLLPVIVTAVPPAVAPLAGLMALTIGKDV